MPNSNNAITITVSAGERGPTGYNGSSGIDGPTGPIGFQGSPGPINSKKTDICFNKNGDAYVRALDSDNEKIVGYTIYDPVIGYTPTSVKVIMSGLNSRCKLSVYDQENIVIASNSAPIILSSGMEIFTIPIIGSFPQINSRVLKITLRSFVQVGLPEGTDHHADISYFEIT